MCIRIFSASSSNRHDHTGVTVIESQRPSSVSKYILNLKSPIQVGCPRAADDVSHTIRSGQTIRLNVGQLSDTASCK